MRMENYLTHTEALEHAKIGKRILFHYKDTILWFNPLMRDMNILEFRGMLDDETAEPIELFEGDFSIANRHELKILPEYFEEIRRGNKAFEIRKNDRDYKVHDEILLKEYDPKKENFTTEYNPLLKKHVKREKKFIISYITNFEQKENYVVLGLKEDFYRGYIK